MRFTNEELEIIRDALADAFRFTEEKEYRNLYFAINRRLRK